MLSTSRPPTLEEFWAATGEPLCGESLDVARDSVLTTDLGFDSLGVAELVMLMDDLDASIPEDLMSSMHTVGDFYDHYLTRTGGAVGRP